MSDIKTATPVAAVTVADTLATLHYHSESKKSACISTKINEFASKRTVGFVTNGASLKDQAEGFEFTLPGGWHLEAMVAEDGKPIMTKGDPDKKIPPQQKMRFEW